MKTPKIVDCMGKVLQVGDMVVYPVRRRSTMTLKKATVCETPGHGCVVKLGVVCINEKGRRVIIQVAERCAVVSTWKQRNNKETKGT